MARALAGSILRGGAGLCVGALGLLLRQLGFERCPFDSGLGPANLFAGELNVSLAPLCGLWILLFGEPCSL